MTEILDAIESSLALAGYEIVGGGDDHLLIRDFEKGETYRLEISECVG